MSNVLSLLPAGCLNTGDFCWPMFDVKDYFLRSIPIFKGDKPFKRPRQNCLGCFWGQTQLDTNLLEFGVILHTNLLICHRKMQLLGWVWMLFRDYLSIELLPWFPRLLLVYICPIYVHILRNVFGKAETFSWWETSPSFQQSKLHRIFPVCFLLTAKTNSLRCIPLLLPHFARAVLIVSP